MKYIDSLPETLRKYILDTEYHQCRPPALCGTMWFKVMQRKTKEERRRMRSWRRMIEIKYYQDWMAVKEAKPSPFLPSSRLNVFCESCKAEFKVKGNEEGEKQAVPEGPRHWVNHLTRDIQESIRERDLIYSSRYFK